MRELKIELYLLDALTHSVWISPVGLKLVGLRAQPHPALLVQRPHEMQVLGLLLRLGGCQAGPAELLVVVHQVTARLLPYDDSTF